MKKYSRTHTDMGVQALKTITVSTLLTDKACMFVYIARTKIRTYMLYAFSLCISNQSTGYPVALMLKTARAANKIWTKLTRDGFGKYTMASLFARSKVDEHRE